MKKLNIVLAIVLFFALPLFATADICTWTHSSVASGGSAASVKFTCSVSGVSAAVKTVTAMAVGAPSCYISTTNEYYNSGTCESPKITLANPCTNSGEVYGTFWAGDWSDHSGAIIAFCGACGYTVSAIFDGSGGEPMLKVTCK